MSARAVAVCGAGLFALAGVACIDDDIPPRPTVDAAAGASGDAGDEAEADEGAADGGPILLASSTPCEGIKLVAFGGKVYWTEEATGAVKSVSRSGGQPTIIASSQLRPGAIAVDATAIFWAAALPGDPDDSMVIRKAPAAGGSPSVFYAPQPFPKVYGDENHINALFISNGVLYFGRYTFSEKIPTDGDTPTVIGHSPDVDLGRPGAFTIDATYLYQVEIGHDAVSREKLDGTQMGFLEGDVVRAPGAPDRIATSQSELVTDAIGMIDDHIVWANGPSIYRKAGNAAETDPATLIAGVVGAGMVTGFVVSDGFVYFGEDAGKTVQVSAVYDGTPRVVVTDQPAPPVQFAADDQNVYWSSSCRIMKLAK